MLSVFLALVLHLVGISVMGTASSHALVTAGHAHMHVMDTVGTPSG